MYRRDYTHLIEERRIRPTLNRKEFIRVAPHLPDIRSCCQIQIGMPNYQNGE